MNLLKIKYNNYLPYKCVLFVIFIPVKTKIRELTKNNIYTKKDITPSTGNKLMSLILNYKFVLESAST